MRRLVLMRHAEADDSFSGSDMSRPLTDKGQSTHQRISQELSKDLKNIDMVLYSPFLRAEQSAKITGQNYPHAKMVKEPALGNVFDSYTILQHIEDENLETILIVGHAPTLSAFGRSLMEHPTPIQFDKSSALILDFKKDIGFGKGEIYKVLHPKELKSL